MQSMLDRDRIAMDQIKSKEKTVSEWHKQQYEKGVIDTTSGNAPKNMDSTAPDIETVPGTKMHKDYWILSDAERAKGFVRPVRRSYLHTKCGVVTTMGVKLAETYARDPHFYGATYCVACGDHFPVGEDGEFVWDDTSREKVGT
jgi:hypothetical protein